MNNIPSRIPVTLVTGFLGSGKTTLLNLLLTEAHGKRIAIIENEFGEVSIDDALLVDANQNIFKMSNGCLCCTINGDLIATLMALIDRRSEFDYVIIETTGLANPAPVVQTFMLNEDIAEAFELNAIVTLVDAKHIEQHIESKECKEQIAFADIVVLNKLDLVTPEAVDIVLQKITALNALAVVFRAERSQVDLSQILGQRRFNAELAIEHDCHDHEHSHAGLEHETCNVDHAHEHLHSHNHDEDVQSVGCELSGDLDQARFNTWFSQLIQLSGDVIYRCKGILSIAGKEKRVIVHTVHRVLEVTEGPVWGADARMSKIVFIGKNLDRAALLSGFKSCLIQ